MRLIRKQVVGACEAIDAASGKAPKEAIDYCFEITHVLHHIDGKSQAKAVFDFERFR